MRDLYDNETHGSHEQSAPPGDFSLNPGAHAKLLRPRYEGGPTIFRPWPLRDYDDPDNKLQPARKSVSPRGQNPWLVRVRTASRVGIATSGGGEVYSWNLYEPWDEQARVSNPYVVFYRACQAAHDSSQFGPGRRWDSRWNALMRGRSNAQAAIAPPKYRWYIQGHVYVVGKQYYVGGKSGRELPFGLSNDDPLPVLQVAESVGDGILDLFALENPEWSGSDADLYARFKYGSPLGIFDQSARVLKGGWLFIVYNPKVTQIRKDSSWSGEIRDIQEYEVALRNRWEHRNKTYVPDMSASETSQIFKKGAWWFNDPDNPANVGLLRFPSPEEQVLFISRAFRSCPNLVRFAFYDHPEWFTDEVNAVLRCRTASLPSKSVGSGPRRSVEEEREPEELEEEFEEEQDDKFDGDRESDDGEDEFSDDDLDEDFEDEELEEGLVSSDDDDFGLPQSSDDDIPKPKPQR